MRILVTYAVEAEFAPWRRLRNLEKISIGGVELHRAEVGRAAVDFLVTGMGAANARRTTEAVASSEYTIALVCGFAGALRDSVKPGDIVAPEKVQPQGCGKAILCARNLVNSAAVDRANKIATMVTADHVVSTAAEKAVLAPFGEAVDMESFTILEIARVRKLPAAVLRVISDSFDRDLPVEIDTIVDDQGNVKIGGVVRYVAKYPLALPALVRLGRDSRTAAEALAHFLEAYIKKLSFKTHGWPPPELQEAAAS